MEKILEDLQKVLDNATISRDYFNRAKRARIKAEKSLEKAQGVLSELKGAKPSQNAFNLSVEQAIDEAPTIMKEEIEKAVSRNNEFAYFAFLNGLLEVADDNNLYEITARGGGWARNISVHLAMNEVAGSIEEYAQAVEGARAALNVGQKGDPTRASEIWRKQIYPGRNRTGPYNLTIGLRLEIAGSPAPFWSLLNDGNKVLMSSDRGGTPYPSRSGTRFVQKTEERIYRRFRDLFINYRDTNKNQIKVVQDQIAYIKGLVKEIDAIVQQIGMGLDVVRTVGRQLGKKVADIDANRLLSILESIQSGELSTGRVNIGVRGRRLRVSISTLAGIDY